jgi:hypothetical protein
MALFQCFYRFRKYNWRAWACISVNISWRQSNALLDASRLVWKGLQQQ